MPQLISVDCPLSSHYIAKLLPHSTKTIVRALRSIKKGEEILDNYGYHYATHGTLYFVNRPFLFLSQFSPPNLSTPSQTLSTCPSSVTPATLCTNQPFPTSLSLSHTLSLYFNKVRVKRSWLVSLVRIQVLSLTLSL